MKPLTPCPKCIAEYEKGERTKSAILLRSKPGWPCVDHHREYMRNYMKGRGKVTAKRRDLLAQKESLLRQWQSHIEAGLADVAKSLIVPDIDRINQLLELPDPTAAKGVTEDVVSEEVDSDVEGSEAVGAEADWRTELLPGEKLLTYEEMVELLNAKSQSPKDTH